jgi:hypothetical protein
MSVRLVAMPGPLDKTLVQKVSGIPIAGFASSIPVAASEAAGATQSSGPASNEGGVPALAFPAAHNSQKPPIPLSAQKICLIGQY